MALRILWRDSVVLLLLTSLLVPATATRGGEDLPQELPQESSDESTIREVGTRYVAAFNNRDAEALAAFWSPDAVYTNRVTGQQVIGREAIAEQFAQLFEDGSDLKVEIAVTSIDFLSPNVAIEKGVTRFLGESPEDIPYSAVYVKRDGEWLLDRVTDDPQPLVTSHYEQLKPLEWLIGSWMDQGDGVTIQVDCNWTKNQSFITRAFTISIEEQIEISGMQIIGWDAGEKRIRSWTFDSDGGFAEEQWSNNGNEWYVIKKGRTADGQAVSAVNVMTYVDDNAFTLKSVQRSLDGQMLPNTDEVMVVRQ